MNYQRMGIIDTCLHSLEKLFILFGLFAFAFVCLCFPVKFPVPIKTGFISPAIFAVMMIIGDKARLWRVDLGFFRVQKKCSCPFSLALVLEVLNMYSLNQVLI